MNHIDTMKLALAEMKIGNYNCAAERLEAALAEQPAQHPKTKQIAECLAVLRPTVKGKFPHEQALEELVGYIAVPQPAQRTWVGLTDDDLVDVVPESNTPMSLGEAFVKYGRAIEAKLKEKNT